ncbi:glutathione S-transferase family protein [Photobacterium sp. SDRW27]|uniref:glutathione S-transferase family protein n=1 Tax=Photobacterium obscurum TaxID=2829490 RepID=UPI002243DE30|nr:glutathione S-transferase family protein [Photobacterium obscurum]MCW8328478.1 glutathione S-transferase family protein [Photobacterium obscurum]
MGIIKPTNKSVESFKGLHLYHTGFSNCAMRVRIALEEKELEWSSHLVDILKGENLTKVYMGINPNAVVPTLVNDGVVVIDSADIIDYLDKQFSPGSLRPVSAEDEQVMYDWMYLARNNHLSIKTYMYGNVDFLQNMKKTSEEMDEYRKNQSFDSALLEFHERFNSNEGFTKTELDKATAVIDNCFKHMDERLKDNDWLAGDGFSLADIAWIPQLVILKVAKYPFENYPNLEKWKNAIIQRPSFKQGVLAWLPEMAN